MWWIVWGIVMRLLSLGQTEAGHLGVVGRSNAMEEPEAGNEDLSEAAMDEWYLWCIATHPSLWQLAFQPAFESESVSSPFKTLFDLTWTDNVLYIAYGDIYCDIQHNSLI